MTLPEFAAVVAAQETQSFLLVVYRQGIKHEDKRGCKGDRNANGVLPRDAGRLGRPGLADLWGVCRLGPKALFLLPVRKKNFSF